MLQLKNIRKNYVTASETVEALKDVSISFRKTEFVSILGPSGCGKTTLLNIVGGLDHYTSGDLVISGRSTKSFGDRDWDVYRNHRVGFIFQSYNLIPHQTVLVNVELALTIAGIPKEERVERAKLALDRVGLAGQYNKKPNQLSGGQCQRVAIARALVNDPEILLADEPTGALDTVTSVQIMELIKEISRERLVIMVTHNPELAEEYSTRIVRLLDGNIIEDTNPYEENAEEEEACEAVAEGTEEAKAAEAVAESTEEAKAAESTMVFQAEPEKTEKAKMSFATAFMLSLKNLFTKKGRSTLTAFAGSIGIIGIALIVAFSSGVNAFIEQVQKDTLSTYPLTIMRYTQDMSSMLAAMTNVSNTEDYRDSGMIHVDDSLGTMMAAMSSTVENNLDAFKVYLDEHYSEIEEHVSDIQYTYDYNLQIFTADGKVKIGMETLFEHMGDAFSGMTDMMEMGNGMSINVFSEMINNQELLDQQYDIVDGAWPSQENEVVLVVNSNNQISKMTLYMLGVLDPNRIDKEMEDLINGEYKPEEIPPFTYDDFIGMEFLLLTTADFFNESKDKSYNYEGNQYKVWDDVRNHPAFDQEKYVKDNGVTLKISGIVRPKPGAAATSITGAVGYTRELTDYILEKNANSVVINQQKTTPKVNVLTGLPFERTHYTPENINELIDKIDNATMDMFYGYMTEQILSNPEFSDRINAKDAESFLGIYMLLPEDKQAEYFERVLNAAQSNTQNAMAINGLCAILTQMTAGITVTPDNVVRLLPVLSTEQVMVALAGIPQSEQMPMPMPGLIALAGEEKMAVIYTDVTDTVKHLTVNEEIFLTILKTLTEEDEAFIQLEEVLYSMAPQIDATYDSVLKTLDDAEKASPFAVNFFARNFESKEAVEAFIADYNASVEEKDKLEYTDLVGTLMSSVTIIVNAISYVLIAFVAISLIVSSIMIGVITLISVQERTKEIGILRAIGASKRDVSSMFNAETIIIGLAAGLIGVGVTYVLCIPINIILHALTDIANLSARLPIGAAVILVLISVGLTVFSGLIPSSSAAKKDPVVALRTE